MDIQKQVRDNAEDLQNFLLDLNAWEIEMRKKEEEFKVSQVSETQDFPPIRNSLSRSKKKNRHKKQRDKKDPSSAQRIRSDDYQAWDKFDVDKEVKKIEGDVNEENDQLSPSDNSENEEEVNKKKQLAILNKDKGNDFFKKGNYDSAINCYTTGMQLDPENPLLSANRAMAFIKKEQFQAAENDCTLCLSIDPTYVKAYLRRGTARSKLGKHSLAKVDFAKVLELEPENKQAQAELEKLKQNCDLSEVSLHQENEVVKSQEFWPTFLGNKAVEPPDEKMDAEKVVLPTDSEIQCILPDSKVLPIKKSSSNIDKDTFEKVCVASMNEKAFIKKVNVLKAEDEKSVLNIPTLIQQTLPPVPPSYYQFAMHWRNIRDNPVLRYQYLKQLPPEKIVSLFQYCMEPEIFFDIIHTLASSFVEHDDDVFYFLKSLTEINRFNTMLMFLGKQEQNDLNLLLDSIRNCNRSMNEKEQLLRLYNA
ncbi:RNA polymerase II-associated protein 3-like [Uloborus diversus]|uniref:RNA polymerase II-associated protein 3-like n=1 Tax=Uloborus diversus TaxID=327109 RepID=UPI00240928CE|nr:RNA polymerase II-associated protein 3-like [Uloborus diversus]